VHRICLPLTQSGHERLRLDAVQTDISTPFARKSLLVRDIAKGNVHAMSDFHWRALVLIVAPQAPYTGMCFRLGVGEG
jgi:hypothetical protein